MSLPTRVVIVRLLLPGTVEAITIWGNPAVRLTERDKHKRLGRKCQEIAKNHYFMLIVHEDLKREM